MRTNRPDQKGFTLVELLVAVIILGLLVAIAIPVLVVQRERAWRAAAVSDLRNAVIQVERSASGVGGYLAIDPTLIGSSPGVTVSFGQRTATYYCLQVDHANLPGGVDFHMTSSAGSSVDGACTP